MHLIIFIEYYKIIYVKLYVFDIMEIYPFN